MTSSTLAPFQVHAKNRTEVPHGAQRAGWSTVRALNPSWQSGADEWARASWSKPSNWRAGEIQRVQRDVGPQAIHTPVLTVEESVCSTTAAPCYTA